MSKARRQAHISLQADMQAPNSLGAGFWEKRIVLGLICLTLLLTTLPYLIGYYSAPPGMRFIGTAYNIDDYCNYLSWIRQTADGYFFFHNLFTTDPQRDLEFNILFWLMGRAVHDFHISPQAAMQATRILGSLILLILIYRFYRYCLPQDRAARLTAFGFACLSSGFGWTLWHLWHDRNVPGSPVDAWQPEAYIFLSIYTSPLFVVSLIFILGALYALLKGEETGQWRYPIIAGLCGAVLGNMHSYDVLHLTVAWGIFLIVWTVLHRGKGVAPSWGRGIAALAITLPTTLYQFYMFEEVAVFRKRADVPTLAPFTPVRFLSHHWHVPNLVPYGLGYGFVFFLALFAFYCLYRSLKPIRQSLLAPEREEKLAAIRPLLFAACWSVGGFVAAYLPFAFQRKMLMGEDIPLCLLGGIGAAALMRHWKPEWKTAALALLVAAAFPSNGLFLYRDIHHLEENRSETDMRPYLPDTAYAAYAWLRQHLSPRSDAVLSFPAFSAEIPGAADRVVWVGHWAETPNYGRKVEEFSDFADKSTPNSARLAFLRSIPPDYLLYPNHVRGLGYTDKNGVHHSFVNFARHTPPFLQPVYANKDFTIYHINTALSVGS